MSTSILLLPRGEVPFIGAESGKKPRSGVAVYRSEPLFFVGGLPAGGSVRYVRYIAGVPVAALQLVDLGEGRAVAANVFVAAPHRRLGHATQLWEQARRDFPGLKQADPENRTELGAAWVAGMTRKASKNRGNRR